MIFIKAAVLPQEKVSESERDGVALLQPLTHARTHGQSSNEDHRALI